MDLRRICAFGAGTIGGRPAAEIPAAGREVSAVARGPQLEALPAFGVALRHAGAAVVFVRNGILWWCGLGFGANRPRPPDLGRLGPGGIPERALVPECIMGGVIYSPNTVAAPALEQLAAIIARPAARQGPYAPA